MSENISLKNATLNILLTINGEIHLVAMGKDELDAITLLVKRASSAVVPTRVSQTQLNNLLNYDHQLARMTKV